MEKFSETIDQLQRTILEIGSEVYLMKNQIHKVKNENQKILEAFVALKKLLDYKNLISVEDFELEMNMLEDFLNENNLSSTALELEWNQLKKIKN